MMGERGREREREREKEGGRERERELNVLPGGDVEEELISTTEG